MVFGNSHTIDNIILWKYPLLFLFRGRIWTHSVFGMGSVWKLRVWVVAFLCIFPLFGLTLPTNPDEGFKFNCGQFLCSFPYQYCDTEGGDYRCLYCRDDFCHSKDQLPDQCRSYCTGNHSLVAIHSFIYYWFLYHCLSSINHLFKYIDLFNYSLLILFILKLLNIFLIYLFFMNIFLIIFFSIISIHIDAFLIDHLFSNLVFYVHVSGFKF